jgi:hypothetical protein
VIVVPVPVPVPDYQQASIIEQLYVRAIRCFFTYDKYNTTHKGGDTSSKFNGVMCITEAAVLYKLR